MDNADTNSPTEREKWNADIRLRERDLEIKAAEQSARAIELKRSRLSNPLVIAVFAAAIAAGGNAWVAWFNGSAQRELEKAKNDAEAELEKYKTTAQLTVEETRSESARILEMIKTADPDKAATNLEFLLKTGLIGNETRKENLTKYLAERKPGQGPSLSSGNTSTVTSQYFTNQCTAKPGLDSLPAVAAALQRSVNKAGSQYELAVEKEPIIPDLFVEINLKIKATQRTVASFTIMRTGLGHSVASDAGVGLEVYTSVSGLIDQAHYVPIVNALKG